MLRQLIEYYYYHRCVGDSSYSFNEIDSDGSLYSYLYYRNVLKIVTVQFFQSFHSSLIVFAHPEVPKPLLHHSINLASNLREPRPSLWN